MAIPKLLAQTILVCTLWVWSNYGVQGELFTAMADFEETLIEEQVVLDSVEQYIKQREAKLDLLRK